MIKIIFLFIAISCFDSALSLTCKFANVSDKYVAIIARQTFSLNDTDLKIFGRHFPGKKNIDVRVLDAGYKNNSFETIPSQLLQIFPKLEEANFQQTGLKILTFTSFKQCETLKVLKFANDRVTIQANVFRRCENLKYLEFHGNDLSNIDDDAFYGLNNLQILILHSNNFTTISRELLKPVRNLVELHITGNQLTVIPVEPVVQMTYLGIMNFSSNEIQSFSSDYLKNKYYLQVVDLSLNHILRVDRDLLEVWPNNAKLNMSRNLCIDKDFDRLGTNDLPMIDVVKELEECFYEEEEEKVMDFEEYPSTSTVTESENKSLEYEDMTEDVIEPEKEIVQDQPSDVLSKEREDFYDRLTTPLFVETRFIFTTSEPVKVESSVESDSVTIPIHVVSLPDQNKTEITGSPFEFINEETTSTTARIIKDLNTETSATSKPIHVHSHVTKNASHQSSESESSSSEYIDDDENDDDEEEEIVTTTEATTTTTTPEPTTVATPKHMKKKKVRSTSTTTTEMPIAADASDSFEEEEEYAPTLLPVTDAIPESTTPLPYLHEYEQATCRFYLDADRQYHCILENVTPELKRINTIHLDGFTNDNVTAVFFRDSVLMNVKKVLFKTFPNLEHLSIEKTNIKNMDADLFEVCGKLKKLDLKYNQIRRVHEECLKPCIALESVDISGNPIYEIESGLFICNPTLTVIFDGMKIVPPSSKK